jgi:hypothetical protein
VPQGQTVAAPVLLIGRRSLCCTFLQRGCVWNCCLRLQTDNAHSAPIQIRFVACCQARLQSKQFHIEQHGVVGWQCKHSVSKWQQSHRGLPDKLDTTHVLLTAGTRTACMWLSQVSCPDISAESVVRSDLNVRAGLRHDRKSSCTQLPVTSA